MLRILGLGNQKIEIPIGHRWVESRSLDSPRTKGFIGFVCAHCQATFALSLNRDGSWTGSFQYFEDSCVESEVILSKQPDTMA